MSLTSSPKSSRSISAVNSPVVVPSAGVSTVGASVCRDIASVLVLDVADDSLAAGRSIVGVSTVGESLVERSGPLSRLHRPLPGRSIVGDSCVTARLSATRSGVVRRPVSASSSSSSVNSAASRPAAVFAPISRESSSRLSRAASLLGALAAGLAALGAGR
jgi:hypothetical protein